jgi:uncharacterized protein YjbI with pentapeptide repeats
VRYCDQRFTLRINRAKAAAHVIIRVEYAGPVIAVAKTFVFTPAAVTIAADPLTAGVVRQPYRPLSGTLNLMGKTTHLEILKQGVDAWNQWRNEQPSIPIDLSSGVFSGDDLRGANLSRAVLTKSNLRGADLRGADLRGATLYTANLTGARLGGADLSRANLSWSDLRGTDFHDADLHGAGFRGAKFGETNLSGTDLSGADVSGADFGAVNLSGADLSRVNLRETRISGANLSEANLSGASLSNLDLSEVNLSGADLSRTDLREVNLSAAICERANFSGADLSLARLLGANLDGATLTGARLWETQRAGWSIKGVICESVYWNEVGKELTIYGPGDFERLYAEKIKVLVRYPDGISPLEVVTLPSLIRHLEASRPGCRLRFESIQDGPGGAVVTIVVEEAEDTSPAQVKQLKAALQAEAEQKAQYLRQALESERESLSLKGEVRALERTVDKLLSRPTFYLQGGDARMGDEYKVGQAGAVGPQSHAHDMTFNQIGGNIEKAMDLSELAGELATLREAMSREAAVSGHYIALGEVAKAEEAAKVKDSSKVAESLKAAGKWSLDVATKIGATLAAEALKESMGLK